MGKRSEEGGSKVSAGLLKLFIFKFVLSRMVEVAKFYEMPIYVRVCISYLA